MVACPVGARSVCRLLLSPLLSCSTHPASAAGFYQSPCGSASSQSAPTDPAPAPASSFPPQNPTLLLPQPSLRERHISTLPGVSARPTPRSLGQKASRQVLERSPVFLFYPVTPQGVCVPKYARSCPGQTLCGSLTEPSSLVGFYHL